MIGERNTPGNSRDNAADSAGVASHLDAAGEKAIIDISPPLSEATAVWPGDTPLSRRWQCQLSAGANIDLSTLTTTVHIGAHADAPSHYSLGAPTIDQVSLTPYIGRCLVATVSGPPGQRVIDVDDCRPLVARKVPRILFRTLSQTEPTQFPTDFVSFTPAAIRLMGEAGVILIGIDTASVDAFESKDLQAHHELLRFGIRNLEGLALASVRDGEYELIALPLRLVGFDASPVRAILRAL